ncbi:isoleucine--tRNA ligase, cytoplasmic isoform X2 [Rhinoderma darwinii]|uniref:isoleucine--tRNA ligase, cytoplasmic isoform X2 n=1 Tax=Rhinoderma darwinii TaxID=43563 RepID=UPI003F662369
MKLLRDYGFYYFFCPWFFTAAGGRGFSRLDCNYVMTLSRLYLINSPVVRAENLRFKEEGVRDVLKEVFLPWYNAFRFLMQNIYRLHKEEGVQFLYNESSAKPSRNIMDKWVLSFTHSLIHFFKAEMTAYRLYTVVPRLVRFVDMLTNWYVRMNRRRLKGESGTDDCLMALETLFSVLFSMCRLMAPFTPFITEMMYQKLKLLLDPSSIQEKDTQSIHYLMLPPLRENLIDKKIESAVSRMQSVIELGRVIRDRKTMPIKYPLKEVVVIHQETEALVDIKSLEKYILEELNVRKVTVSTDKNKYGIRLRAEPDHMVLGKRLKGSIKVEGHELHEEDVRLLYTFDQGAGGGSAQFEAHSDEQVLVLLDVTPDQSMVDEGVAREVINRIQKLRKKGNLVPTDEISVYYQVEPRGDYLQSVIRGHTDFILATVKSPLIQYPVPPSSRVIIKEKTQLKGCDVEITLVRGSSPATDGPACAYVKLHISVNRTELSGFLLLENPKGAAISSLSELKAAVSSIFNLKISRLSVYDGNQELPSDADLLNLNGKVLSVTSGAAPDVPSNGGALHCKYVNLRLLSAGTQGTLLLQNPVGQNSLNYHGLYHEVARVFGLRSRRFCLYLDAAMSGEVTPGTALPDLHTKTLYVHVLPTTAEC